MSIFVVTCIFVALYLLIFHKSRKAKILSKFPAPSSLPIIGHAHLVTVANDAIFRRVCFDVKQLGGLYVGWIFNIPYLIIARSDVAQKVLSSNTHIDKSSDYDMLMPWLGTGLLTSKGQKWFHRRKLLTPAFHFKILDDFLDVFNEQSLTLVRIFREEFGDGKAFNVFPYITRCALDIICETAMGRKINAQQNKESEYVKAVYRIGELIQYRQVRPWLHPNFIWKLCSLGREEKNLLKILHGFTEKVIAEKKAQLFSNKKIAASENDNNNNEDNAVFMKEKRRVAFLDLLLTAQSEGSQGNQLSDVDIREETDTFMFEGHDTTAANINWTTFLLGCNPECQLKVQKELDEIFGGDKERAITNADMSRMKYLECCIKESLRLYPSVPFLARAIKSDLQIDNDMTIPAGTTAFVMPYQLHRDPNVFPEPEAFHPERFFPENSVGRNPFTYVPFSAGPRNCVGQKFAMMEEKVILANIFRSFKVEAAERREDLILLAELIMRPKDGLRIKLKPRD